MNNHSNELCGPSKTRVYQDLIISIVLQSISLFIFLDCSSVYAFHVVLDMCKYGVIFFICEVYLWNFVGLFCLAVVCFIRVEWGCAVWILSDCNVFYHVFSDSIMVSSCRCWNCQMCCNQSQDMCVWERRMYVWGVYDEECGWKATFSGNTNLELVLCRCCVSEGCVSSVSNDVACNKLSDVVVYEFVSEFMSIHSVKCLNHLLSL